MKQCFDFPVVSNRGEEHLKMATFLKASGCEWTFDEAARDDEIAGVKNIASSEFLYLEEPSEAVEGACANDLTFLVFKQKHFRSDKGSKFFSYVLMLRP